MKGSKLSHVSNSQEYADCDPNATATHSPDSGFGCFNDQNPEYCDTSVPAADSNVFVRKSSKEAKPNQNLFDTRLLASLANTIDCVILFSLNDSMATSSEPYLKVSET